MWTQLKLRSIQEAPPVIDILNRAIHDEHRRTRFLLGATTVFALWFLNTYALKYLTLSRDSYGIFWPRHEWLLAHIIAGALALLLGPIQFWPGVKKRLILHRLL